MPLLFSSGLLMLTEVEVEGLIGWWIVDGLDVAAAAAAAEAAACCMA